jgi:hypothetical protein
MLAFHYILAFAIDYTLVNQKPTSTNCVFSPFWDTGNLSPSVVAAVKAAHPNVAVMVGIGGDKHVSGCVCRHPPDSRKSPRGNLACPAGACELRCSFLPPPARCCRSYQAGLADSAGDCEGMQVSKLLTNRITLFRPSQKGEEVMFAHLSKHNHNPWLFLNHKTNALCFAP